MDILDICLLNANVVYNSIPSNDRVSSLDFRVKVIEGLLSTHKKNPACITVELSHVPNPFAEQHYPGRNVGNKKRDCVVCSTRLKRRQTRMMCKQCQRPMCVIALRNSTLSKEPLSVQLHFCRPSPPPHFNVDVMATRWSPI